MKNNRIQVIRATLAIMVVLIHTLPTSNEFKIIVRPFLNVAVAGFIFLSGYLTKTEINAKRLYRKRIIKALIPYVIFTIIYTVVKQYKKNITSLPYIIIKNLVTASGRMILYYLVVYIQLVLLTPFLTKIAKTKNIVYSLLIISISPLFILFYYVGIIHGEILEELPYCIMFFPVWIAYYYLGLIIGNKLVKINLKSTTLVTLIIIGLLLQIAEGFFWLQNTNMKDIYYSQIRITSFMQNIPILILISRYIRHTSVKYGKHMIKIGDASFGIYLLHPLFISICDKLFKRNIITFLITFSLSFAGAYITVLMLNKFLPKKLLGYVGLSTK